MVSSKERTRHRLSSTELHTLTEHDSEVSPRDSFVESSRLLEESQQTEPLHSTENLLQRGMVPLETPKRLEVRIDDRPTRPVWKDRRPTLLLPFEPITFQKKTLEPTGKVMTERVEARLGRRLGGGFFGDVWECGEEVIKAARPTGGNTIASRRFWRDANWAVLAGTPFPSQTELVAAQLDYVGGLLIKRAARVYFDNREFSTVEPKGYAWLEDPKNPTFAQILGRIDGRGPRYDQIDHLMLRRAFYNRIVRVDTLLSKRSVLQGFQGITQRVAGRLYGSLAEAPGKGGPVERSSFPFLKPPHEVEDWLEARGEFTNFCWETGFLEHIGQVHEDNPFSLPNIVKRVVLDENGEYHGEDKGIVWIDTCPGIPHTRFLFPFFYFRFHGQIQREVKEQGGTYPTFNKIYTEILKDHIRDNEEKYKEVLGGAGFVELQGYITLYDRLREQYEENRQKGLRALNIIWWQESGKVSEELAGRLERSKLYYLAYFPLNYVPVLNRLLGSKEYREHIQQLVTNSEYRQKVWRNYKETKVKIMRGEGRVGENQEVSEDLTFTINFGLSKLPFRKLHRLLADPEYREAIREDVKNFRQNKAFRFQVIGERVLAHAKEAYEKRQITTEEWDKLRVLGDKEALEEKGEEISKAVKAYVPATGAYLAISTIGNFVQLPSFLLALRTGDIKMFGVAFAPGLIRLGFTALWERLTGVDFKEAKKVVWVPTFGTGLAIPLQMAATLGAEFRPLVNIELRHYLSYLYKFIPWGEENSLLEYRFWRGLIDLPASVAYEAGEMAKRGKEMVERTRQRVIKR